MSIGQGSRSHELPEDEQAGCGIALMLATFAIYQIIALFF